MRSPDSPRDCSRESQHTKLARSSTTLSSSRAFGSLAPMAQTSAPSRSHSPRSTGSLEVVAVTTTSCLPGSRWDSPGSAPTRSQKARSRSGVRQYATARSIVGTAARIAATWLSACHPQPITPNVEAPGRARYFAATPLAAPVRSCPSRFASTIAATSARSVSKSRTKR